MIASVSIGLGMPRTFWSRCAEQGAEPDGGDARRALAHIVFVWHATFSIACIAAPPLCDREVGTDPINGTCRIGALWRDGSRTTLPRRHSAQANSAAARMRAKRRKLPLDRELCAAISANSGAECSQNNPQTKPLRLRPSKVAREGRGVDRPCAAGPSRPPMASSAAAHNAASGPIGVSVRSRPRRRRPPPETETQNRVPPTARSLARSCVALMRRIVPERARVTSDSVVAPPAVG